VNEVATSLWERAKDALRAARHILPVSADTAASRAYYAAFYAASATFALEGRTFRKHSAVEAAVHRDLAKAGAWPTSLGEAYSRLAELRSVADYGQRERVNKEKAQRAVQTAADILRAVAETHPDEFTGVDEE
jgi:uncharacterized protein (UPF0332 family)